MVWFERFWLRLQTLLRRNRNAQRLNDESSFISTSKSLRTSPLGLTQDQRYPMLL